MDFPIAVGAIADGGRTERHKRFCEGSRRGIPHGAGTPWSEVPRSQRTGARVPGAPEERLPDVGHPHARLGESPGRRLRQEHAAGHGTPREGAGHGPHGGLPLCRLVGRPRQTAHPRRLAGTLIQADAAGPARAHHRRALAAEAERHRAALGAGGQRDGQRTALAHGTYREEPQAVCRLHPCRLRCREGGVPAGHGHRAPGPRPQAEPLRLEPRHRQEVRRQVGHDRHVALSLLGHQGRHARARQPDHHRLHGQHPPLQREIWVRRDDRGDGL